MGTPGAYSNAKLYETNMYERSENASTYDTFADLQGNHMSQISLYSYT